MFAREQHTENCNVRDSSTGLFVHDHIDLLVLLGLPCGREDCRQHSVNLQTQLPVVIEYMWSAGCQAGCDNL